IEMLVVISIVGLLVAVLLPALRGARVASHKIVSVTNARQISAGLHSYASDYRSSMPFSRGASWNGSQWDETHTYWPEVIVNGGYLSTINIFWSPGRENQVGVSTNNYWPYRQAGYGLNPGPSGEEADFRNGDA